MWSTLVSVPEATATAPASLLQPGLGPSYGHYTAFVGSPSSLPLVGNQHSVDVRHTVGSPASIYLQSHKHVTFLLGKDPTETGILSDAE